MQDLIVCKEGSAFFIHHKSLDGLPKNSPPKIHIICILSSCNNTLSAGKAKHNHRRNGWPVDKSWKKELAVLAYHLLTFLIQMHKHSIDVEPSCIRNVWSGPCNTRKFHIS